MCKKSLPEFIYMYAWGLQQPEEGVRSPGNCSYGWLRADLWVLEAEPRSSVRRGSALSC